MILDATFMLTQESATLDSFNVYFIVLFRLVLAISIIKLAHLLKIANIGGNLSKIKFRSPIPWRAVLTTLLVTNLTVFIISRMMGIDFIELPQSYVRS
jgi:hypothetical protein